MYEYIRSLFLLLTVTVHISGYILVDFIHGGIAAHGGSVLSQYGSMHTVDQLDFILLLIF